ncbi:MAG TPA: response regulator [Rickettsiales bacterium]|nr:response regulator [Rickettsiales bacterium]
MNKIRVLIIEDELEIRKLLKVILTEGAYDLSFAEKAAEGIKLAATHPPDIIILDLGLPDMDGLEVIRNIREWSALPIIVLSARGQEQDKVAALELGADDYLTKPFGSAELLARLKVALRHAQKNMQTQTPVFETGEVRVDMESRQVFVSGIEVHLTPTEYKLLTILVKHAGKVVTHSQLLKEVWGKHSNENSHYLRIYAQHLRKKLGDNPMQPRYIVTEAGIGYRFLA